MFPVIANRPRLYAYPDQDRVRACTEAILKLAHDLDADSDVFVAAIANSLAAIAANLDANVPPTMGFSLDTRLQTFCDQVKRKYEQIILDKALL